MEMMLFTSFKIWFISKGISFMYILCDYLEHLQYIYTNIILLLFMYFFICAPCHPFAANKSENNNFNDHNTYNHHLYSIK